MTNDERIREKLLEAIGALAEILPLLPAPPNGPQLTLWVNEALTGRAHDPACGSEVKKIRRRPHMAAHRRRVPCLGTGKTPTGMYFTSPV